MAIKLLKQALCGVQRIKYEYRLYHVLDVPIIRYDLFLFS